MAFGLHSTDEINIAASTILTVTCGANYTIGLSPSSGNTSGSGFMKSGINSVSYQLSSTPTTNGSPSFTAWGSQTGFNTQSYSASLTPVLTNVYGLISSLATSPAALDYLDTVTATLSF